MPPYHKMLILELFDNGGELTNQIRQDALDIITPYLGSDLPFVTVNQIIDGLRNNSKHGIVIDRSLVMSILDPDHVKAVSKIEGNRIYLAQPEDATRKVSVDDEGKDQEQVSDMAQDQATKQVQK